MKHLSQQRISMEMRRPFVRKWRRTLQRRLASPGLSADARRVLERDIHNLGEPKIYNADDPPPVGARRGGEGAPVKIDLNAATAESLTSIPHTKLYLYALQHDLEVAPGDTKAQVVQTILGHAKGEAP
jgi:hypothetical protein